MFDYDRSIIERLPFFSVVNGRCRTVERVRCDKVIWLGRKNDCPLEQGNNTVAVIDGVSVVNQSPVLLIPWLR